MPETDTIQVMGRGANVDFTIDDTVPFETAAQNLREYLSECRGLYSKGTVSVNVGRRILFAEQLSGIKRILDKESGLTVSRYWCAPEILEDALTHNREAGTFAPAPGEGALEPGDSASGESPGSTVAVDPGAPIRSTTNAGNCAMVAVDPGAPIPSDSDVANGVRRRLDPGASIPSRAVGSENPAPGVVEQVSAEELPEGDNTVGPAPAGATEDLELESDSAKVPAPASVMAGTTLEKPPPVQPESQSTEDSSLPYPTAGGVPPGYYRGSEALIIKTTCRSGEVIRYPGDVVVLADVNPGAEIIAGGDIVVLGALRGMAHAGAGGDLKSTIIALSLESYRLQIGPHIGEAPERVRRAKPPPAAPAPKIAYLRRSSIFVAPFVRRYEEHQGGILYEG